MRYMAMKRKGFSPKKAGRRSIRPIAGGANPFALVLEEARKRVLLEAYPEPIPMPLLPVERVVVRHRTVWYLVGLLGIIGVALNPAFAAPPPNAVIDQAEALGPRSSG